jgi:hypothetical protein
MRDVAQRAESGMSVIQMQQVKWSGVSGPVSGKCRIVIGSLAESNYHPLYY